MRPHWEIEIAAGCVVLTDAMADSNRTIVFGVTADKSLQFTHELASLIRQYTGEIVQTEEPKETKG